MKNIYGQFQKLYKVEIYDSRDYYTIAENYTTVLKNFRGWAIKSISLIACGEKELTEKETLESLNDFENKENSIIKEGVPGILFGIKTK